MKTVQISLFDDINSKSTSTYNEVKLEKMLVDLRKYINNGIINTSDTYFNIATHREARVEKLASGTLILKFAQSSDSERLLSAYEANVNIEPRELLGVGVAKGALNTIEKHIEENPTHSTRDILEHFNIFNYPTYRWVHAQSESMEELEKVKKLILDWANLKEEMLFDLSEGKFTFMRTNKRAKTDDQTKIVPQCFDGMCLEKNFMKMLKASQGE